MAEPHITIDGLDDVIARIMRDLRPALRAWATGIAAEAQNRIAPYPSPSRKPQAFKSDRQRRGFFARLRSGAIRVPYRRRGSAGGLASKWLIERTMSGARLRNTSPYAPLVHSATDQAAYHHGTWKTDKGVAEAILRDGTATQMLDDALQHVFGES